MSLRIAFDCDGCLADLSSALELVSVRLFGEPAPPGPPAAPDDARQSESENTSAESAHATNDAEAAGDTAPTAEETQSAPPRIRTLTRRQQHVLWAEVAKIEDFWETLQETEPGIIRRLYDTAKERRWEVIFITQRPASAGDTVQLQTQRWLVKHGFELPSVYVIKGTRGKIAEALSLDVVVDDRPENCLDVKLESRARAILISNEDPANIPPNARKLGIEPVTSLGECLDLLCAIPSGKPGWLSRLKKLVGT